MSCSRLYEAVNTINARMPFFMVVIGPLVFGFMESANYKKAAISGGF